MVPLAENSVSDINRDENVSGEDIEAAPTTSKRAKFSRRNGERFRRDNAVRAQFGRHNAIALRQEGVRRGGAIVSRSNPPRLMLEQTRFYRNEDKNPSGSFRREPLEVYRINPPSLRRYGRARGSLLYLRIRMKSIPFLSARAQVGEFLCDSAGHQRLSLLAKLSDLSCDM
jgi:hypothetical protein